MRGPILAPIDPDRPRDKADIVAILGALSFFLSTIEYMVPRPLPFMRLGIANLPILLAVDILPLPWLLVLAIVKVIGMSLVSGSLFSFVALFSLAGTLTAALAMWAARRLGKSAISAIGISVLGAAASNAAQILLSALAISTAAAGLIAPMFLGLGLATGLLLGVFAERFSRSSAWLALAKGREAPGQEETDAAKPFAMGAGRGSGSLAERRKEKRKARRERSERRRRDYERLFDPAWLAATGLAVSIAFLLQANLAARASMCAAFLAVALLSGGGFSLIATAFAMSGIILANLLVPMGRVIGYVGPFTVTMTALTDGIDKALVFEGLILLSRASILPSLRLPGRLGRIIASAFVYFQRIVEYRGEIRPASLMRDADRLMMRAWEDPARPHNAPAASGEGTALHSTAGKAMLLAAIAISYILLLI